jgi:broad specificity phosphatase PhoE
MQTAESTLYVVRHGENPANLNREFSYKLIDYSLTPKGVRQAEETAAYLRDKDIREIYSSPLKRAVETAEIIAAPLGLPVTLVEEFRENNVGALEQQAPTDENWALHDRIIEDWYAGRHDSMFPDGEDFHTLLRRVRLGITEILGNGRGGEGERRILIVAHGGVMNGMARGLAKDAALHTRHLPNCAISEFAARLAASELDLRLRQWAFCDHLS